MAGCGDDLIAQVAAVLARHPGAARYLLAFSGGLDSSVLLDLLAAVLPSGTLEAVHVDHGLHPDSRRWAEHCRAACARLGVPFASLRLDTGPPAGASLEDWARRARYAALRARMRTGDCLITAHHADDQAETVLLALLRGSGPHGLRAMSEYRSWPPGALLRPLLAHRREALAAWAATRGLEWVEDPANRDPAPDRNYLRRCVLPAIAARWPRYAEALGRVARWQAEAAAELDRRADADLEAALDRDAGALWVPALRALEPARRAAVLRRWIRARGLEVPGHRRLAETAAQMLDARTDARPCVRWNGVEMRRYRDRLYLVKSTPLPPRTLARRWDPARPLELPHGVLRAVPVAGAGLRIPAGAAVEVRLRRGGERARLPGRRHRSALKTLFQHAGVPPWERDRVPFVYVDGRLAAVAGLWVFDPFAAGPGDQGLVLDWQPGNR